MKPLFRYLMVIVTLLLLYESLAGWLWHHVGYYSNLHLFLSIPEFLIRNVIFPILLTVLVKRIAANGTSSKWPLQAFLVCLIPLLISTSAGSTIARIASGYYGSSQSVVGEFIISSFSWSVTFIVLMLAFLWNKMLNESIVRNLGYGIAGFLLGEICSLFTLAWMANAAVPLTWGLTIVIAFEAMMLLVIYGTSIRRPNVRLRILMTSFWLSPLFYLLPLGILIAERMAIGF